MQGIVIKSTGSWFQVKTLNGNTYACRIRGKFRLEGYKTTNPLAVGDIVEFDIEKSNEEEIGVIHTLSHRRNYIIRKSNKLSSQSQIIASNIDLVMPVVTLVSPPTSMGFVDRILVTAEAYKIPVLLVFNKVDLYDSVANEVLEEWLKIYHGIGIQTFCMSSFDGKDIENLRPLLYQKTTLICGHSGAGKSSIINALNPDLKLKTGIISDQHQKGKHTTTFAEMFEIDDKTKIIDTPGIRDFGVIDIDKKELGHYFPEIKERMSACKFHNCTHINEPKCAVLEALEKGEIHESRYYNYLSIFYNEDTFA